MLPYVQMGPLSFSTFDAARLLAIAATAFVFWRRWRETSLSEGRSNAVAIAVVAAALLAGLVGSRTWRYLRPVALSGIVDDPLKLVAGSRFLFVGLTCSLLGAAAALKKLEVPLLRGLDALVPGIAAGQVFYRIGCFLTGDGCYGPATDLPWGMAFPHGTAPISVPVHPTMLYEAALMLLVSILLWKLRDRMPAGGTLSLFLILIGAVVFLTQHFMLTPGLAFGLTEAQLSSFVIVPVAAFSLAKILRKRRQVGQMAATWN